MMRHKWKTWITVACLASMATPIHAQTVDPALNEMALFGINRGNGEMKRYNFSDGQLQTVGTIRLHGAGSPLLGIDGSAYIPSHQCIVAFWTDPSDGKAKMVYVDTETGDAAIVGTDFGAGHVGGAVAALTTGNAVLGGAVSINPSNSANNEFNLTKSAGGNITRDDLHQDTSVNGSGVFWSGDATYVRVRPKGPGSQNGLMVNGEAAVLLNESAYTMIGSMNVTIWNDHIHNGKAMGHWMISFNSGTASVMGLANQSQWQQWSVFATQKVEDDEDDDVDFVIDGDSVVPSEPFYAKFTVLGAAITYGGQYAIPVTTRFKVGGSTVEAFGDFTKPVNATVNDNNNPRHYIHPTQLAAGTRLDAIGRSWVKKQSHYNGNSNNHWQTYMTVDSSTSNSQQLIVLRHGNPVPNIQGFLDQGSIQDFVVDFVDPDTNTIVLDENQAIFLFELGTTDMGSAAADFQDLVVLVTLATNADDLQESDDDDDSSNEASRLIKVDHKTGGYAQIMTLDRTYDGLATIDGFTFYATRGNEMWRISVANQTETMLGTMTRDNKLGLEFAGSTLLGFEIDGDQLQPMAEMTGGAFGTAESIGMHDLGTMVLMPLAQDPSLKSKSYD